MNRFIASEKRILSKKLYFVLIALLLLLTVTYKLLPEKSKSSDIRVAIFIEDDSEYASILKDELSNSSSLYRFYYPDRKEDTILDVQSDFAECGFIIPNHFFSSYIEGNGEIKVSLLETPSTTLSAPICETLFRYIFEVTSPQILTDCVNNPQLNSELKQRMNDYVNGENIFQMQSLTDKAFNYKHISYRIELPVFEFACLLLIFAGMFGLLLYLRDCEKDIYIALHAKERFGILCCLLLAAMLPMFSVGIICTGIVYQTAKLARFLIVFAGTCIVSITLSFFIKKSTTLAKIMPILLFVSIIYFFVGYIL